MAAMIKRMPGTMGLAMTIVAATAGAELDELTIESEAGAHRFHRGTNDIRCHTEGPAIPGSRSGHIAFKSVPASGRQFEATRTVARPFQAPELLSLVQKCLTER
jgi:hypothetical protein